MIELANKLREKQQNSVENQDRRLDGKIFLLMNMLHYQNIVKALSLRPSARPSAKDMMEGFHLAVFITKNMEKLFSKEKL